MQETTPQPIQSTSHKHKFVGLFVVLGSVIILLVLGYVYWPTLRLIQQSPSSTPTTIIPLGTVTSTDTTSSTITTSSTTITTTQGCFSPNIIPGHYLGERIPFFANDEHFFCKKNEHKPIISVTVDNFLDSRCPGDVVCIWAGEQTVDVAIRTYGAATTTESIQLGTTRKTTATFQQTSTTVTLYTIEEGKGGTYAEMLIEHP